MFCTLTFDSSSTVGRGARPPCACARGPRAGRRAPPFPPLAHSGRGASPPRPRAPPRRGPLPSPRRLSSSAPGRGSRRRRAGSRARGVVPAATSPALPSPAWSSPAWSCPRETTNPTADARHHVRGGGAGERRGDATARSTWWRRPRGSPPHKLIHRHPPPSRVRGPARLAGRSATGRRIRGGEEGRGPRRSTPPPLLLRARARLP